MRLRLGLASMLLPLVAGCAAVEAPLAPAAAPAAAAAPAPASAALPTGARLEPSGFATILDAPPAPFVPAVPAPPPPPTPDQLAAQRQFARAAAFQNEVMAEVTALDARLRSAQPDNYVSLYFDNEGEPSVVFQFLRDGPGTLARYTRHPRFVGKTVRFSERQLHQAADFVWATFGADRVIESTAIGANRVAVRVSVPEAEFRALVARRGVTLPEPVELEFTAAPAAVEANAPLPPALARLVRILPRDDRPAGMLHSINSFAKIELRDGCLRAADREGALVLFPLGTRLFVDAEGYLAFASGEGGAAPGYGRVGETLIFPGSVAEVTAPELVAPIHAACGPGRVIKIEGTASAAAARGQEAVSTNALTERHLRESYGLGAEEARRAVARCAARGDGVCRLNPPPPVANQSGCPAGTRLSAGLCRTPEGHVRPIPDWLLELMRE